MPNPTTPQTTTTLKKLMDGRLRLERRNANPMIYARAHLQGKDVVFRTKQTAPHLAQEVAEAWWLDQRSRLHRGEHLHGRLFSDVTDAFIKWVDDHRHGEISEGQIQNYSKKWRVLKPFFAGVKVTDVTQKFLVDLRDQRSRMKSQFNRAISPSTINKDFILIRQVLKHAKHEEHCLAELPHFPTFQGPQYFIATNPTPFFTLDDYNRLMALAKTRMAEPGLIPRIRHDREELWAFILLCGGAALRVGEAQSLRWMDCERVWLNNADKQEAIRMMVKGKHFKWTGKREEAYGLYQAVTAYNFLQKCRPDHKPEDFVFLKHHNGGLARLLEKAGLRTTDAGQFRTGRSFRHTAISLWLEYADQPNILDIAKWARTSVEQVQAFYDQNPRLKSVDKIAAFKDTKKIPDGVTSQMTKFRRLKEAHKTARSL